MAFVEPVPVEPESSPTGPGFAVLPGGATVSVGANADQLADGVIFDARPLFGKNGIVEAAPAPPAQYPGGQWTIANQGWWKDTFGRLFAPPPTETRPKVSPAQQAVALQILATAIGGLAAAVKAGTAQSFAWYLSAITEAQQLLPVAALNAGAQVIANVNALEQRLTSRIQAVANYATDQYFRVEADLNTWVHALVNADARVESNVASYALGLSNGARSYAAGLFQKAEADLAAWARALVAADAQVERNNAAYTDAQVAKVGDQLGQQSTILHGEILNGVGQAEAFAVGLVGAAGPKITADVLGRVQPQIDALATEADECLKPLCDTVTPNASQLGRLGDLLRGLEGLALPALLFSLVGEAVADPQLAADGIVAAAGWVPDVMVELTNAVLG